MIPSYMRAVLFALVAAAAGAPAAAQQPTQVAVHVQLTDKMYRLRFGQQVGEVERQLAEVVAAQLGRRLGFVRFVPSGAQPHRLTFSLDRNDRASTGQQVDRGFWVKLTQPGKDSLEAYWFTLRQAHTTSAGVGTRDALLADVKSKLELQDYKPIGQMLGRVPVASEVLLSETPLGWALPFRRDVLCMLNETEIRVDQIELEGQVPVTRPYGARIRAVMTGTLAPDKLHFRNGLLGLPHDPALKADLQRAISRKSVRGVEAVYVIDYQHAGNCGLEALPPNTGSAGGGGA